MVLKSGEKVLVDADTTIQRMMLIFYGLINVGAVYAVATDYAEEYVGYWLAFLLPGIIYFLLPILLLVFYQRTIKLPPSKSAYNSVYSIYHLDSPQPKRLAHLSKRILGPCPAIRRAR
jgi:hypothetical protein